MQLLRLALADMRYEWRLSGCFITAICAVLIPVFILLGLKTGVIDVLEQKLLASPSSLELVFNKHVDLDDAWFDRVAAHPDTLFVAPASFSSSASMDIATMSGDLVEESVKTIITKAGDPLLKGVQHFPQNGYEAIASHRLQKIFGIKRNDTLIAYISRNNKGSRELHYHPVTIVDIAPPEAFSGKALFIHDTLMIASQSYKQQQQVPLFNIGEGASYHPLFPPYPRARLYASSLEGVARLTEYVTRGDVSVVPRSAEVAQLQSIDRMLSSVFGIIVVLAFLGVLLSLTSSLWANIDRKRHQLALLQLLGLRKRDIACFPIIQAIGIVSVSIVLSLLVYYASVLWINQLFSGMLQEGQGAMLLDLGHLAGMTCALLVVACLAALCGAYRATKIEPAEAIRGSL